MTQEFESNSMPSTYISSIWWKIYNQTEMQLNHMKAMENGIYKSTKILLSFFILQFTYNLDT